jgi:hypothetical protein
MSTLFCWCGFMMAVVEVVVLRDAGDVLERGSCSREAQSVVFILCLSVAEEKGHG